MIDDSSEQARVLQPGWLVINAMPFARVEVDGKPYGSVPPSIRIEVLAETEHIVRLIWRADKIHDVRVTVGEGETKEINHVFKDAERSNSIQRERTPAGFHKPN